MRAIIIRSLYIYYPIFVFKEVFKSGEVSGKWSSKQVMMARERFVYLK